MQLSISNIAWEKDEEPRIAELLQRLGVTAVDVAPSKYFQNMSSASDSDISKVRHWWNERGISVYGMQSLLYGTKGLNVFGGSESQSRLLQHLGHVCRIAEGLGAKRLVFGSPKNRDRTGLTDSEAEDIALRFFGRLGDIAQSHGVVITLEPNPVCYGTNWITTTKEAHDFVKELGNPGIAMQLDTGTVLTNSEDRDTMASVKDAAGHVHLSEPRLLPLCLAPDEHNDVFRAAADIAPGTVTIEMLTKGQGSTAELVERSVRKVQELLQEKR
jgi:sugar phosphate isomerase/epimerase